MTDITVEDMEMVLEVFRLSASPYEKKVIDAIEAYLEEGEDDKT